MTPDRTAGGATPAGPVEAAFAAIERAAIAVGAVAVLLSAGIIVVSIFGRILFSKAVPDGALLVQNMMILIVILPLAVVAGRRAHIAVDLVVSRLSPAAQRRIDMVTGSLGVLFLIPIAWSGWTNFSSVLARGSYFDGALEMPEWPVRLLFLVGYLVFILRSLHRLYTDRNGPPAKADLTVIDPA